MHAKVETHNICVPEEVHMTLGKTGKEKRVVPDVIQVAAGQQHSMLLCKNGSVYSWGMGLSGQLGLTFDEIAETDLILAK